MQERKQGWYWVKMNKATDKWRPDYYKDGKWHSIWSMPEEDPIHFEIGSRIPAPDEPWQSVPKEPDGAMMVAGLKARVEEDSTGAVYRAMLAAAP